MPALKGLGKFLFTISWPFREVLRAALNGTLSRDELLSLAVLLAGLLICLLALSPNLLNLYLRYF